MTIALLCQKGKRDTALNRFLEIDASNMLFRFEEEEECCGFLRKTNAEVLLLESCGEENVRRMLGFLKENGMKTVVCLVGDNEKQSVDAYCLKCDCFVHSGLSQEDYDRIMETLSLLAMRVKKLRLITFGNFEVIVKNTPIVFRNVKAKELLALCVDRRGSVVRMTEAINVLWPEKAYDEKVKRLYRKAVMSLRGVLRQYGAEDFFQTVRAGCRIDPEMAECDYYSFIDDPYKYMYLFNGRYMFEYSWAEKTVYGLMRLKRAAKAGRNMVKM